MSRFAGEHLWILEPVVDSCDEIVPRLAGSGCR